MKTKITMDKRRVHLQFRQQNKNQNENANRLYGVLLVYGIFSLFMAFAVASIEDIVLAMIIFHSYLLFMMAMTLITDFSSVLLDTTDNLIILPRPVDSGTFFVSRMVHVFIYLFQFGFVMSVCPVVAVFLRFGFPAGLYCIITCISTVLFSAFLTYLLYLAVLKFSNESKLREIVTYMQIFMAVVFTAGYQIVPRLVGLSAIEQSFSLQWYSYIAPPVWMAVSLEAITKNIYDGIHASMIVISIVLPVLFFWLLTKYFAPSFSRKLSVVQEERNLQSGPADVKRYKRKLSEQISRLACKSPTERAAFEITWKISGRERQFRLQFYPVIGYIVVLVFIFVFRGDGELRNIWDHLRNSTKFLWFVYIPLFMITSSMSFIAFNENYQAAWVYLSSPIEKPGYLVTGSLKTLFIKFFVPVFILMFIFCLSVWGFEIIDDFAFGVLVNLNCFLIMATLSKHYLPFSVQPIAQQFSGRFLQMILLFFLIAVLIGLHWLGLKFPIVLYALIPISFASSYFLIRNLQRLPWKEIAI